MADPMELYDSDAEIDAASLAYLNYDAKDCFPSANRIAKNGSADSESREEQLQPLSEHSSPATSSASSSDDEGSTGLETTLSDLDIDGNNKTTSNSDSDPETDSTRSTVLQLSDFDAENDSNLSKISEVPADLASVNLIDLDVSGDGRVENDPSEVRGEIDADVEDAGCVSTRKLTDQDLFKKDDDGDTILHVAIILLLAGEASSIIDCAVSVANQDNSLSGDVALLINNRNKLFQTPLHLAVLTEQHEVISNLIQNQASIAIRDHLGRTPLHIACEMGDMTLLRLLLQRENSCEQTHAINLKNFNGEACIHIAAKANMADIVKFLISKRADINSADRKSGRTALHFASELGHMDIVGALLDNDADAGCRTLNEESAIELAHIRGNKDIEGLLKRETSCKLNKKHLAKFMDMPKE